MGDRPILFSGPMVRAILDGRKTQTRRVLRPQPYSAEGVVNANLRSCKWMSVEPSPATGGTRQMDPWRALPCSPGDRLWVRESLERANGEAVGYPADGTWLPNTAWEFKRVAVPSIHMPRWASRLTLIVTDVRAQRVQQISEADALAEGVECDSDGWRDYQMPHTQCCSGSRTSFQTLWDSLNASRGYGWGANPWVVAISFEAHRCNIDRMPQPEPVDAQGEDGR